MCVSLTCSSVTYLLSQRWKSSSCCSIWYLSFFISFTLETWLCGRQHVQRLSNLWQPESFVLTDLKKPHNNLSFAIYCYNLLLQSIVYTQSFLQINFLYVSVVWKPYLMLSCAAAVIFSTAAVVYRKNYLSISCCKWHLNLKNMTFSQNAGICSFYCREIRKKGECL